MCDCGGRATKYEAYIVDGGVVSEHVGVVFDISATFKTSKIRRSDMSILWLQTMESGVDQGLLCSGPSGSIRA